VKIWFPFVTSGSGADVYVARLGEGLRRAGHEVEFSRLPHWNQYFAGRLKLLAMPVGTDIVIANSWNGFSFRRSGSKLVVVEHHCIFDPDFRRYRNLAQAAFHELFVRGWERRSFRAADAVVTVSRFTASRVASAFPGVHPEVVLNGVDSDFFTPLSDPRPRAREWPCRLLFVGNLSRRKGADLLSDIMAALGHGFELRYTTGLRARRTLRGVPNARPTGRLSSRRLREEYRRADLLLFPSRLEGFGYVAAEAMACGTPVIATNGSALPELIEDGVSGRLCPRDDVSAFARAVRELCGDPARRAEMGRRARERVAGRFSIGAMVSGYLDLFRRTLGRPEDR